MKGCVKKLKLKFIKKYILYLFFISLVIVVSNCEYEAFSQGKALYESQCANCHSENGQGLRGLIPPLAGADYLENNQEQLACIIRYGMQGEIIVNGTSYNGQMVGIPILTDVQINNIINYINHSWGNDYGQSNVKQVARQLEQCEE